MDVLSIKNQFIEEIGQLNDIETLLKLREFLHKIKSPNTSSQNWLQFAGIWSEDEANEMSQNIKDCEKINTDEW